MILGEVEETVTTVEIDEETYEEMYKVTFVCPAKITICWIVWIERRSRADIFSSATRKAGARLLKSRQSEDLGGTPRTPPPPHRRKFSKSRPLMLVQKFLITFLEKRKLGTPPPLVGRLGWNVETTQKFLSLALDPMGKASFNRGDPVKTSFLHRLQC